MNQAIFMLAMLTSQYFEPRFNVSLQFLIFQIQMLRKRIHALKIVPTTEERLELIRLGAELDHKVRGLMCVVQPKTYQGWIAERKQGKIWEPTGRKGTPEAVRNLLLRMSKANSRWGHRRIVGELKKLGIRIGATTVRDLLKRMGLFPEPTKENSKGNLRWKTFIEANKESMLATDFFSKNVWSLWGKRQLYFLAFIHISSRKVYCSVGTYNPDDQWVTQQCRNAMMWAEDEGIEVKRLLHDRDGKFKGPKFNTFWEGEDVKRVKTPVRAPKANAFIESWVGSIKKEVLNHIFGLSRGQLNYVVNLWVSHYNAVRPHRGKGIDNNVLDVDFKRKTRGEIVCEQKLGGLITEWSRDAA